MRELLAWTRWLLFLLLVWLVAVLPRWLDPAMRLWANESFLAGDLEVVSRAWEGPEGKRRRAYVEGTLRVPERGWELPYRVDVDEATLERLEVGERWPMRVAPFPSPAWFEGRAVVATPVDLPAPPAVPALLRVLRGPLVALLLFFALYGLEAIARRRHERLARSAGTGVLELETSAPAPAGCSPLALGLGVALAAAWVFGWGAVWWIALLPLLGGLLGAHRAAVVVDRNTATFRRTTELLFVRWSTPARPFGLARAIQVAALRTPNGKRLARLEVVSELGEVALAESNNEGLLRVAAQRVAHLLGVPFLEIDAAKFLATAEEADEAFAGTPPPHLAHLAGKTTAPRRPQTTTTPPAPAAAAPSPVSPRDGEPAIPRFALVGCLVLLLALGAGAVFWWTQRAEAVPAPSPSVSLDRSHAPGRAGT